jgi:very-short-patch-repair endonuclease
MTRGNEEAGEKRESLTRAVARYHAGCLRVIGSQNVALRDVRTAKKAALTCDVGVLAEEETILAAGVLHLEAPKKPRGLPAGATVETHNELRIYEEQLLVWERVRELVQKAALEPYAKEIVYAAPLLVGYMPKHGGRVEPVLAPLFTQGVNAVVQHDGSILFKAQDESLRFNTALWQDSTSAQNIGQIQSRGIDAQGDLSGGWDPERVEELLKGISAILPFATPGRPEELLEQWPERGAPHTYRAASPSLELHQGAALFVSNKSSHYLLHDLEQIQEDPSPFLEDFEDRPLSILVSDPSDEDRPSTEWLTEDQVGFPFPSNPAQRQVADALDKNALVVVQGPPGTGKSLTIANLVAHLVGQGKSVLVTSHKQQALTVVRDKLNEMDLNFLYASLIGDTSQAKRELQSQIANVKAFAGTANQSRLEKQLAGIEMRRAESGAQYAAARDEFISRAEPEQVEAAGLHPKIEAFPLLPIKDPVIAEDDMSSVASALRFLDAKAREHGFWEELIKSKLASSETIETVAPLLRRFLDHQNARVRAATEPEIKSLVEKWHPTFEAEPSQIVKARKAISEIEEALLEPLGSVLASPEAERERECARALVDSPELLSDAESSLKKLKELFGEARQFADARTAVSAEPVRRGEVRLQHQALASLMRRRAARRWLDEHAAGAAGLQAEAITRWCSFWDTWSDLQTQASGLGGGLGTEIGDTYEPDSVARLIARVTRAVALAAGITAARKAVKKARVAIPLNDVVEARDLETTKQALNRWVTAISAAEADQEGNKLIASEDLVLVRADLTAVDDLLDQGQIEEVRAPLSRLEAVWLALPDLAERRDLLGTPVGKLKHAVHEIETAGVKAEQPPAFLAEVERSLSLHSIAKRFAKIASNRSTRDLAIELRELHQQVLEDARRLLGLRIQARILAGFRKPRFLASLEAFKKAVSTSAKRHERFEELKNSETFDIDILTDVFPCWIMRPEDACRIFPLRKGIFDVVIFDEASQCNSDQALPLFARAVKVAVFGDQKQLTNEDLRRSLSSAANKALLRAAELEPLDPSGLFDQTRNSLLDLVSQRQQATVLLNEHFRCRPEIVAFSNEHFYGSTLRVIRDRADDHGLGPALVIRQVLNPLSGGGGKINYAEARAIVDELAERLRDTRYEDMTFGVLSLFREQIEHIQNLVEREIDRELLDRHRVICSTVDGFQGDERDVILYSWRFAPGASPAIFAFTNGEGGQQRVNVALTRARHQAIHFVSSSVNKFPVGASNITPYLKHSLNPGRLLAQMEQRAHRTPGGEARRRVAKALLDAGFQIEEDFVACGTSIDLLATGETEARVAVFVDAEVDPHPDTAALLRVDAHSLLERAGWRIVRLPATDALPSPQKTVGLVTESIADIETKQRPTVSDSAYSTVSVDRQRIDEWLEDIDDLSEIAPEDRADYHWEVGNVDARLHAGDTVFMSDFERELYDRLASVDDLIVVPQWPSRSKFIDLVVTDSGGRRLAIEADGEQHHEMESGGLIPEDIERQGLLEEAGWVFHRIRHSEFKDDPAGETARLLEHLDGQPANADLAARMRGEALVKEAVSTVSETRESTSTAGLLDVQHAEQAGLRDEDDNSRGESKTGVTTPPEVESLLDNAFHPEDEVEKSDPVGEEKEAGLERSAVTDVTERDASIGTFADLPLRSIALRVSALVTQQEEIREDELVEEFSVAYRLEVPRKLHNLLQKFAWSAKGHKFIQLDEAGGRWVPGDEEPHEIDSFADWTFNAAVERAAELLPTMPEKQVYEQMLGEVYRTPSGRVPRIVTTIVGKAIYAAKHQ